MRKTWDAFCDAKPNYGRLIFVELFQRHPTFLNLFPVFGNRPLRDTVDTPRFVAHASAVGAALSAIVGALDDPGALTELIRKTVASHRRKPGVRPEHFERLLEVVLATMQRHCPALMTAQAVEAWTRLFYLVMDVTMEEYATAPSPLPGQAAATAKPSGTEARSPSPGARNDPSSSSSSSGTLFSALDGLDGKRQSIASEFTVAPSQTSLPAVPPGVKTVRPRRSSSSGTMGADAESTAVAVTNKEVP